MTTQKKTGKDPVKSSRPTSLKRAPRPAADANVDPIDTAPTASVVEEAPAAEKVVKKRGPYNVQRVKKTAVTTRQPDDVIELIELARNDAAAKGDRLTKDEVVTKAVRAYWGRKLNRKS